MRFFFVICCIATSFLSFSQDASSAGMDVYSLMGQNAERLKKLSGANSVSIGLLKDGQVYTQHYGEIDKGKGNKTTDKTPFEIASVTKVMTGYLMAKAVLDKKINLEDDVRKYLDGTYPNLEYQTIPVRIKDLVSFKAALDREIPDAREIKKTNNDSTMFRLKKMDERYSKQQFLADLKTIKLDTVPGNKHKYSNTSLELSALILEKVYHKNFETLLEEQFLSKAHMNSTRRNLKTDPTIANGYNVNGVLMPNSFTNLWAAGGYRNSTMNDLIQFLKVELDTKNSIVRESQRNILNSEPIWNGYFWDEIGRSENGKYCYKHGGSYGTNTLFIVYPELQIGLCIIVNVTGENTFGNLYETATRLVEDLEAQSTEKMQYGYRLISDQVVFTYQFNRKLDLTSLKSITVAGSFNDWNPDTTKYRLRSIGQNAFELKVPKSQFEKGKLYAFKFVMNKNYWLTVPQIASNTDQSPDNNLTFLIE